VVYEEDIFDDWSCVNRGERVDDMRNPLFICVWRISIECDVKDQRVKREREESNLHGGAKISFLKIKYLLKTQPKIQIDVTLAILKIWRREKHQRKALTPLNSIIYMTCINYMYIVHYMQDPHL
jgi:hypothetical protein